MWEYSHTKCGGKIDTKSRTCTKCHKHWNPVVFILSFKEIRPIPASLAVNKPRALKVKPGKATYAGWANKIPGVGNIASRLPNWPRWARLLVTVAVVSLVIFGISRLVG